MISLALVYEKQDDISRAETMLLRALEIVQRAYGPKHKEVKKCRALIKSFYEKQNMVNKLASLSNWPDTVFPPLRANVIVVVCFETLFEMVHCNDENE